MIVISDTSPIHYLIQIGETDLLGELFGRVIIPRAVHAEMQRERTPMEVKTRIASPPSWLDVREADVSFFTPHSKLGDGEREAIALAIALSADALLMDDRDGIKEARAHNLTVVTTLGILEKGAKRNLLDLRQSIRRLSMTNFRMPVLQVVEELLERDAQRRKGVKSDEPQA